MQPGEVRAARKQQTRDRIAERAMELFVERGFDRVSTAQIAQAAGVTEKTVFNHFPTKEDLVYSGDPAFEADLRAAASDRAGGVSAFQAVAGFLQDRYDGFVGSQRLRRRQRDLARLVTDSPRLQARERAILARYAAALAEEIGHANPDDLRAQVVADALIAVHHATIGAFRRAGLQGREPAEFGPIVAAAARAAFDQLGDGLRGYAVQ